MSGGHSKKKDLYYTRNIKIPPCCKGHSWSTPSPAVLSTLSGRNNEKKDIEDYGYFYTGLSSPKGVAVDWTTDVVYVVSSETGQIVACVPRAPSNCVVVQEGLEKLQDIIVDHHSRYRMKTVVRKSFDKVVFFFLFGSSCCSYWSVLQIQMEQ